MSKVLAAIDNSAAARPVLAAGAAFARLLHADLEALHLRENGDRTARAAAEAAGLPLRELAVRELPGSKIAALLAAGEAADVEAMVVGARASRIGRRPVGHIALELIVSQLKPLLVVPPHAFVPERFQRILVPLDGTRMTSAALAQTIELAHDSDVDVVALHVHEQDSLPLFSDQPQHEVETWRREFFARHCPHPEKVRLEVRVGIPAENVLRAASESESDLIALGWAQSLGEGRAAIVREALERSDVPILLVPVVRGARHTTSDQHEAG